MNKLSNHWNLYKLGDICKTTSGGTPSRKNTAYFDGEIPWVKSGELPDGPVANIEEYITDEAIKNSSAKVFPAGTLLIALYGATVGKLGILNRDAATNQAVCAIFPRNEIDTKFLFWYLRYVRSDLIAQAVGGAQPNISQGILKELEIPVPQFQLQKRIVAEIEKQFSRLDEAVANLKRVKANLKRYKAAVLKAAVEGKLTEEWRKANPDVEPASKLLARILAERRTNWKGKGKYKELVSPETARLPELPKGWMWVRLDALCAIVDSLHKTPSYVEHGYPMVRVTEVRGGKLDLKGALCVTEEVFWEFTRRYQPKQGDIVLSRVGTYGNASLVVANQPFCLGQNTAILAESMVESVFLHKCLESSLIRQQIDRAVVGSSQKTLSLKHICALAIPVPPLAEQQQIAAEFESRLSVIEELEFAAETNFKRADRCRQSLLKKAFSG